eukprot:NODE_1570_length_1124_cov_54.238140_g1279_i0.p1 GENE.NODE_1570_length_1124_cov_54.238140_g1279_i0~~NODE_1570_length_1124_cov_54.238140_g1279_i0.p1  ORF type:complete len:353 (-),score=6.98 NODE_1570_length_1124_cov_54.238140_g1279_i0:22-1080(-)
MNKLNIVSDMCKSLDEKQDLKKCILSKEEQEEFKSLSKTCPVFKSGCPLKDVKDHNELLNKMNDIPYKHPKCPTFKQDEIQQQENTLVKKLFQKRWDIFFNEPLVPGKLGSAIRRGTMKKHIEAEKEPFIKKFLKKKITVYEYRIYLANLYFVYKKMEEITRKLKNDPILKVIYFETLHREKPLADDLEYLYGKNWKKIVKPLKETVDYMNRLEEISKKNPSLLISHMVTRYLGDMYGGQKLSKKVKSMFGFVKKGSEFYRFDQIDKLTKFRMKYEHSLNGIKVVDKMEKEMVDEANIAFQCNINMFKAMNDEKIVKEDKKYKLAYNAIDYSKYVIIYIFFYNLCSNFNKIS